MYSVSVRDTWNSQSSLRNMARSGEQYSGEQMELWGETNQTDVQQHVTNIHGPSPYKIYAFCISRKVKSQRERKGLWMFWWSDSYKSSIATRGWKKFWNIYCGVLLASSPLQMFWTPDSKASKIDINWGKFEQRNSAP